MRATFCKGNESQQNRIKKKNDILEEKCKTIIDLIYSKGYTSARLEKRSSPIAVGVAKRLFYSLTQAFQEDFHSMPIIKMDIKRFLNNGILEKYVLGLASPEEMEKVDRLAKEYPEINTHICKMQNCMEEYAEMHAVRPPKHLKEKVLSKLDDGVEKNPNLQAAIYHLPMTWKWGAGIAAMMILSLGVLSFILFQKQKATLDELALLSTQVKHLQSDQLALQASSKQIQQKYSVLKDITTRQVTLKGSQIAPQSLAVVYWSQDQSKGYLNIVDLPKCPDGHQYQMWADVNGTHIDMGMLKMDENGTVLHNIPYINGSRGFVITLEKEGGSLRPTITKMYAHGEI